MKNNAYPFNENRPDRDYPNDGHGLIVVSAKKKDEPKSLVEFDLEILAKKFPFLSTKQELIDLASKVSESISRVRE